MPAKKRYEGIQLRLRTVGVCIFIGFSILVMRLWYLQIVNGYDYSLMARENRLHPERLKAPRGIIYGSDNSVLAESQPAFDLIMVPAECGTESPLDVYEVLKTLISIPERPKPKKVEKKPEEQPAGEAPKDDAAPQGRKFEEKPKKVKKELRYITIAEEIKESKSHPYRQILLKEDVPKYEKDRVDDNSFRLPGVSAVSRPKRNYHCGKVGGQLIGYINQVTSNEIVRSMENENGARLQYGDLIGRAGIEQKYQREMRGEDGEVVLNVYVSDRRPQLRTDEFGRPVLTNIIDSYGRSLLEETDRRKEPKPGEPIYTTLDIGLQGKCEELLEKSAGGVGAIAVLEADTGAILAMASTPRYDPGIFVTRGHNDEIQQAFEAKPNPMRSRCYQEQYAPGSVFKVMLATAALEEGVINEKTEFFCPGFYQLEGVDRKWHCWQRQGHGGVAVVDALAYSCDVFFYNVGRRLGVNKINEWAAKLGLGIKTGVDLPQEVPGLIPSEEWKKNMGRKLFPKDPSEWRWYPGNTINLAIGQGQAATTPLQNAVMMACIVNGGRKVRPFINKALGPDLSKPFISKHTIELVRAGLRKCVEKDKPAPSGTGKAAKMPGFDIIGKTGSAQIVGLEQHEEYGSEENIPYALRDHAWFVAGVLDHEPKIAMCVLVEHGHHGSSAAAPLAKEVIGHYYAEHGRDKTKVAQGDAAQ